NQHLPSPRLVSSLESFRERFAAPRAGLGGRHHCHQTHRYVAGSALPTAGRPIGGSLARLWHEELRPGPAVARSPAKVFLRQTLEASDFVQVERQETGVEILADDARIQNRQPVLQDPQRQAPAGTQIARARTLVFHSTWPLWTVQEGFFHRPG